MSGDRVLEGLPQEIQPLLRAYLKRVVPPLATSLESLVLYGSSVRGEFVRGRSNVNLLLVMTSLDGETLRKLAKLQVRWKREQVMALLFTPGELQRWATSFPLEFCELKEAHRLLAGRDLLPTIRLDEGLTPELIRREAKANLLRLRQRYVEGGGTGEAGLILLSLSMTGLAPCFRGWLRLRDRPIPARTEQQIEEIGLSLSIDSKPLLEAWDLRCGRISPGPVEVPRLFDRYLTAVEELVHHLEAAPT
jgi:predicted nucleotidyltransferase